MGDTFPIEETLPSRDEWRGNSFYVYGTKIVMRLVDGDVIMSIEGLKQLLESGNKALATALDNRRKLEKRT